MAMLVQFNFPYRGSFGQDRVEPLRAWAESITQEPGFIWKIWIENAHTQEGGGIYLFKDDASARAYVQKHTARLGKAGVTGIEVKVFEVNDGLTAITRGPVS